MNPGKSLTDGNYALPVAKQVMIVTTRMLMIMIILIIFIFIFIILMMMMMMMMTIISKLLCISVVVHKITVTVIFLLLLLLLLFLFTMYHDHDHHHYRYSYCDCRGIIMTWYLRGVVSFPSFFSVARKRLVSGASNYSNRWELREQEQFRDAELLADGFNMFQRFFLIVFRPCDNDQ